MASESPGRQVAVVPYTDSKLRLAKRMAPRCAQAGIEIALIGSRGEVIVVTDD
jgi:rhamnose utilization protein RhaD (predicted bifunctional aldolase and dehydrogenase)